MEVDTADSNLCGKHLDSQVRIRNVGIKSLHDSVHKFLVQVVHVQLAQFVVVALVSGITVTQKPAAFHKVEYAGL